jgi:hypothetical protein
MEKTMNSVEIEWFGPYSMAHTLKSKYADTPGFYQMLQYENGNEKLLFIGKAVTTTISSKIQSMRDKWLKNYDKKTIHIRIGKFSELPKDQVFRDAECMLVYKLKPEHNDKCKDTYKGKSIHIKNRGRLGNIEAEYEMI